MAYPPQEIGNLFNELDGFEVAIFQTDWENPFGNMYKPYYKTDTANKKNALQNAKYVTAADGFSQQNIRSVLQAALQHAKYLKGGLFLCCRFGDFWTS